MSDRNQARRLTAVLRHKAPDLGIPVRSDGFVRLSDLKVKAGFNLTVPQFQQIVKLDTKMRFSIQYEGKLADRDQTAQLRDECNWFIRANQGHSFPEIKSEELLTEIRSTNELSTFGVDKDRICHGTYLNAWEFIQKEGLKKMGRTHIHFARTDETFRGNDSRGGVLSGFRTDAQVLIYLDIEAALKDGIRFFISANRVILTEGVGPEGVIAPKYFRKTIIR